MAKRHAAPPLTLPLERRRRIILLLERQGTVRVPDLSRAFGVSEVTIRHDLEALAREGALIRDRGGAIARTRTSLATAFEQRAVENQDAKRRIGAAAAAMVAAGETIIIDAGTTTREMARELAPIEPLTVVTNALNIAVHVGALPAVHLVMAGGSLSRETISTVGAMAERDLSELVVDKLFLGAHAASAQHGLLDLSIDVARVKKAMIRAARQVILLIDSAKWNRRGVARIAPLSAVHTVITDGAPLAEQRALKRLGIKLLVV